MSGMALSIDLDVTSVSFCIPGTRPGQPLGQPTPFLRHPKGCVRGGGGSCHIKINDCFNVSKLPLYVTLPKPNSLSCIDHVECG